METNRPTEGMGSRPPRPIPKADMRHHNTPPTAARVQGMDASQDPSPELRTLDLQELRIRAKNLAIPGWESMPQRELVESLRKYWQQHMKGNEL